MDTQPNVNTFHHTAPWQYQSEFSENPQNYFQDNTQPNVNTPQHTVTLQNRSKISENSQNYFRGNAQPNVNAPQHAVPSQNIGELSENSRCLLTQVHTMEPKSQRPQKNGGVRRNIMRTRNNAQNWEPQDVSVWKTSRKELQDVHMCETSRVHQQNNWWPNNQPDTTSYLQLPLQEQRRHVVNYEEEEDLSWCNKCGEPGHIRAFCAARVFCSFCRMRSHSNKACWNQQCNKRVEPFSSSRQTTPVQNSVYHGQVQNYGEQKGKQTVPSTNQVETSN